MSTAAFTFWDPHVHVSPHQALLKDMVKYEADDVPIAQAQELSIDLPTDDRPKSDCYIDDIFTAFLETDLDRVSCIVPFVLFLLG